MGILNFFYKSRYNLIFKKTNLLDYKNDNVCLSFKKYVSSNKLVAQNFSELKKIVKKCPELVTSDYYNLEKSISKQLINIYKNKLYSIYKLSDERDKIDALNSLKNDIEDSKGYELFDIELTKILDDLNYKINNVDKFRLVKNKRFPKCDDPLYMDIISFSIEIGEISGSLIQRRFRINYNRAARIIDCMEEDGIIGPQNGYKPRKVLANEKILQILKMNIIWKNYQMMNMIKLKL